MIAILLGKKDLDFHTKEGDHIKGTQIFCAFEDAADSSLEGRLCDRYFLRENVSLPKGLAIGKRINIAFNRKGKVESITAAE